MIIINNEELELQQYQQSPSAPSRGHCVKRTLTHSRIYYRLVMPASPHHGSWRGCSQCRLK